MFDILTRRGFILALAFGAAAPALVLRIKPPELFSMHEIYFH